MEGMDKDKHDRQVAAEPDEAKKKELRLEWEEQERRARMRSLGNIR